jgi:poly(U)-specific endoribonuclease
MSGFKAAGGRRGSEVVGCHGEAPTLGGLDRLKDMLGKMKADIEHRIESGMNPNTEQLAAYVGQMVAALKKMSAQAPIRIKRIMFNGFCKMGYDFIHASVVHAALFTLPAVADGLGITLSRVDNWSPDIDPTEAEVADITKAADRLWDLDTNRLVIDHDIILDIQGEKSPGNHRDVAKDPLFKFVDPRQLARPTFKAFISLLDNYAAQQGQAETYTAEEEAEMDLFMNLICDTAVMKYTHAWLHRNGKVPADMEEFKSLVRKSWFELYRRKRPNDSSGFEHVFLGEREGEKVTGLHNWIQMYIEEKQGNFDYKGKIRPRRRHAETDQFITIQFEWMGQEKFISSSLIGTSPEFEFALLSMCFFNGVEKTRVDCGPHKIQVTAYQMKQKHHTYVGTAFPEACEADINDHHKAATKVQRSWRKKKGKGGGKGGKH